ncbi:MAG: hypothetical protein SXU28_06355 [Pseudomonadota bacterium]|nr:hypothetical protein [Pseudomonadota bacterium]
MTLTGSRLRQIGWSAMLGFCLAGFIVLSLTVHAVRNEVVLAEREIIELKQAKQRLETEFQARASQHQLAKWNRVDLGYKAPRADQYLDTRKDLAALGVPLAPDAPSPVRVARAETGENGEIAKLASRDMVSPVSGEKITLAAANAEEDAGAAFAEAFGDILIEASPIREARAQTVNASFPSESNE